MLLLGLLGFFSYTLLVPSATKRVSQKLPTPMPTVPDGSLSVKIDTTATGRPISPYIYGIAQGSTGYMSRLGTTINRWGGNPASRYNWELGNAWNSARDYFFANTNYNFNSVEERKPGGSADQYIAESKKDKVAMVLTIPALGYVAKNSDNATRSQNVPNKGGISVGKNGGIRGYEPAQNRLHTSIPMFASKNSVLNYPPNLADNAVYADEWLDHILKTWGNAASGGVKFYSVDNEPDLWAETHTDVHPVLPSYDEILAKFLDYGSVIRRADASAKITGPGLSSIYKIANSPLDGANGGADRRAHSNKPFLEWWLSEVKAHDDKTGIRTLDVLDLHYYPAGDLFFGKDNNDPELRAERLDSTRALWDQEYAKENDDEFLPVLPNLKGIVERNYPNTLVGITEWNWGGEKDISGALAVADVLGIFGEQDLYLANYWTFPPENSPVYYGFKMFGNYDEAGSRFGNLSLPAVSSDRNRIASYAGRDKATGVLTVVLINKTAMRETVKVELSGQANLRQPLQIWQYSQADLTSINKHADLALKTSSFDYDLGAYSITLFKVMPNDSKP